MELGRLAFRHEAIHVEDPGTVTGDVDQSVIDQMADGPRHGLRPYAEHRRHVLARNGQVEAYVPVRLDGRVAVLEQQQQVSKTRAQIQPYRFIKAILRIAQLASGTAQERKAQSGFSCSIVRMVSASKKQILLARRTSALARWLSPVRNEQKPSV